MPVPRPEELEEKVREFLKADYVKVLRDDEGKVYSKYDMGYAAAVVRRRVRGRWMKQRIIALVRLNTRRFTVVGVIPVEAEAIEPLYRLLLEVNAERARIEERERERRREEKLRKWLETLTPEERRTLAKLLDEG